MVVTTSAVRQGAPSPACPYRIGAGPSDAFYRRHVLRVHGTRRGRLLSKQNGGTL